VLREHGLIDEQRPQGDGRGRVYRLRPGSLDPLAGWPVVRQSIEVTFGPGVHLQAEAAGRPRG
jgi:hypothetical protein